METVEITVTREVDVHDLCNELIMELPDFDSIADAGLVEDDIDEDTLLSLLKAVVECLENRSEEE